MQITTSKLQKKLKGKGVSCSLILSLSMKKHSQPYQRHFNLHLISFNFTARINFISVPVSSRDCSLNSPKNTSSQKIGFCFCFDIQNNICTQHVVNLYFGGNSRNNLSSYCGLTDSRMRASEKYLAVCICQFLPKLPKMINHLVSTN